MLHASLLTIQNYSIYGSQEANTKRRSPANSGRAAAALAILVLAAARVLGAAAGAASALTVRFLGGLRNSLLHVGHCLSPFFFKRSCAFKGADGRPLKTLQLSVRGRLSVVATGPESSTSLTPEAIQRLVDHHRQFLAFLQTRVESRAAAEDILQSAFVKGLERGAEVRDEESAVAWFYRVLRNAVIDHYRHRASTERAMEAWGKEFGAHETPDEEVKDEICQCISGLLETLKPEYRDALRTIDIEEGSLNDLAEQAGITSGNAAVRVHRAREALRKQVRVICGSCAEHGCLDCRCKPPGSGSC